MPQTLNQIFDVAGRAVGEATMRFDRAIAARLGINTTDYKCLDVLLNRGPIQAGELARATGFTTGAVTGIVNRLVQAGYVERRADPADARRVVVAIRAGVAERRIWPLLTGLDRRLEALHASLDEPQRALLLDYLARLEEAMRVEADAL